MPQVGKLFPRSTFQDVHTNFANLNARYAPRAIRIENFQGSGTLVAKWAGLTVVSQPSERLVSGVRYQVVHPTDATAILVCDLMMSRPFASDPSSYWFRALCDYYDGGVLMGHFEYTPASLVVWNQWRLPPIALWNFSSSYWTALSSPAAFSGFYGGTPLCRGQVASWEEQPDFQPYRTRP